MYYSVFVCQWRISETPSEPVLTVTARVLVRQMQHVAGKTMTPNTYPYIGQQVLNVDYLLLVTKMNHRHSKAKQIKSQLIALMTK